MSTQKGIAPIVWIIVAAIVFGGVYVAVEKLKVRGPKQEFQKEESKTVEVKNDKNMEWQIYRNEKYSFTITLPPSWKDYRVSETSANFKGVVFGIRDQDNVFSIVIMTKKEYADCQRSELCPISFIAQNSENVFALAHAQDYSDTVSNTQDLTGQATWDSIISSFRFTK